MGKRMGDGPQFLGLQSRVLLARGTKLPKVPRRGKGGAACTSLLQRELISRRG